MVKSLAEDFGIIAPLEAGVHWVPCPACRPLEGPPGTVDPKLAAARRKRAGARCLRVTIGAGDDAWGGAKWECLFCGAMGDLVHGTLIEPNVREARRVRDEAPIEVHPAAWEPNALARLLRRGISTEAIERCRVTFEPEAWIASAEQPMSAIVVPYRQDGELVAVRYITSSGLTDFRGAERVGLLGIDDITYAADGTRGSLIPQDIAYLVPDEMSKLAMETAGYPNTVALPYLPAAKEMGRYFELFDRANYALQPGDKEEGGPGGLLDRIETIYIAMNSDAAGKRLEEELIRRLGPDRCVRVRWPKLPLAKPDGAPGEAVTLWDQKTVVLPGDTLNDANEVLFCMGAEAVQQAIRDAKPVPIDGVFRVDDFEAEIWDYYYNGLPPGFALGRGGNGMGNAFLNKAGENCLAFQTRTTCVWTGIPGHGKSRVMENVTVELSRTEGFKWVFFSPEVNPLQLFATYLMSQWSGIPFNTGATERMNEAMTKAAIAWLQEHYFFLKAGLLPFSVQDLLDRATKLVRKYGVNGMVIDPWNNVYHSRKAFEREDEYIGQALQKINAWREQNNVLVHIVAHPGKFKLVDGKEPAVNLNDIKGGSEFFSMTDFGFSVWRDRADENTNTIVHIQKSKFQHLATLGAASLKFDKPTSKFYDAGVPFGGVPQKHRNQGEAPIFDEPDYRTQDGSPPWMQGDEYEV